MLELKKLNLVTHQSWLLEEFKTLDNYDVVQNFGWDFPEDYNESIFWCPGDYVAQAAKSGVQLNLLSAGPKWLANIDYQYTWRNVWAGTAKDLFFEYDQVKAKFKGKIHGKLAEAKLDYLPARLYKDWHEFCDELNNKKISMDSYIQISEPMDYIHEMRFFVVDKDTRSATVYLVNGKTWDDPEFGTEHMKVCKKHGMSPLHDAQRLVKELLQNEDCPPGFVVDVGLDSNYNLSIIEANASWSSNIYEFPASAVIKSIEAGNSNDPKWLYKPDATQLRDARGLKIG